MHKKAEGSTTGWENVYEYEETALLETAEESFGLLSVREVCSRDFFFHAAYGNVALARSQGWIKEALPHTDVLLLVSKYHGLYLNTQA